MSRLEIAGKLLQLKVEDRVKEARHTEENETSSEFLR